MSYGMCKQNSNSSTKSVSLKPTIENSMDEVVVFDTQVDSSAQPSFSCIHVDKANGNKLSAKDDTCIDLPSGMKATEMENELNCNLASFPNNKQPKCKRNLIPGDSANIKKENSSLLERAHALYPNEYFKNKSHLMMNDHTYSLDDESSTKPIPIFNAITLSKMDVKSEHLTKQDVAMKKPLGNSKPNSSEDNESKDSNKCTEEFVIKEPQSASCRESLKMIERSLPASNGSVTHKNSDHENSNGNHKNDGFKEIKVENGSEYTNTQLAGITKAPQEKKQHTKTDGTMKEEEPPQHNNDVDSQESADSWVIAKEVEVSSFSQPPAETRETCYQIADFIIEDDNCIRIRNDYNGKEDSNVQPQSTCANFSTKVEVQQLEDQCVKNGHTNYNHGQLKPSDTFEKKKDSAEKISEPKTSCTSSELSKAIIRRQLPLKRSSGKEDKSSSPSPKEPKIEKLISILKKDVTRPAKKFRRTVSFNQVDAFYFFRQQNRTTVPAEGGSSLGMAEKHHMKKSFSIAEHRRRRLRHRSRLSVRQERDQRLNTKIKELKREMPQMSASQQVEHVKENHVGLIPGDSSDSEFESSHSNVPDHELNQFAECPLLTTISPKKRRFLLRLAKVKMNSTEKLDNEIAREKRALCGCTCENFCHPDVCSCHISGIPCQYDREDFPCGCTKHGCGNTNGRVQFDSERVSLHYQQSLDQHLVRRPTIPTNGTDRNLTPSFSSIATTSAGPANPRLSPYVTMIQEDGETSGNGGTRRRPRRMAVKIREHLIRDVPIPPIRDVPVPPSSMSVMISSSHENNNNGTTTSTTPPLVPPYQPYETDDQQNCGLMSGYQPSSPQSSKYCSEILSLKRDSMRKIFLARRRNRNRNNPFLTAKDEKNGNGSNETKFYSTDDTTEKPTTDIRVTL